MRLSTSNARLGEYPQTMSSDMSNTSVKPKYFKKRKMKERET
ncbi:hypothetical protein F383_22147 [Gossypium arboreum]|uniref:Uncharacterized protein n=1 Tax=Gossypium arboreum TaxID=29729 RepID=A0A0B0NTX7_GOSAR|nr:hypothetical protein F383_22147 [Gossypium arboreum]